MRTARKNTGTSALSCSDLEKMGMLDTALGPCRAAIPDGRVAFVCCAVRKQLLGGAAS